jgi:hypothetical protein
MTSLDLPPTKRPRTGEFESVISKRSDPWFNDGTVVLQVAETQFRVYRGILSAHSLVFRDMFAMPQPAGGEELVDGCSVVHMHDSVEDWRLVLKALHGRR